MTRDEAAERSRLENEQRDRIVALARSVLAGTAGEMDVVELAELVISEIGHE